MWERAPTVLPLDTTTQMHDQKWRQHSRKTSSFLSSTKQTACTVEESLESWWWKKEKSMVLTNHWCPRQLETDAHSRPISLINSTYFHFILPSNLTQLNQWQQLVEQLFFTYCSMQPLSRGQGQHWDRQEWWTGKKSKRKSTSSNWNKFQGDVHPYLIFWNWL